MASSREAPTQLEMAALCRDSVINARSSCWSKWVFTPVEAIKIATLNGPTYMRRQDQIGSIAPGKNARWTNS